MKKSEYALLAQTVDWYWWHVAKRAFIQTMLSKHEVPRKELGRVLDFGCGVGSNQSILAKYGRVTGTDISTIALQYARRYSYHQLIHYSSANTKQLWSKPYDLIACFDVLYHQQVDDKKILSQMWAAAKPGAWLLITDCAHQSLFSQHDNNNMARERYAASELLSRVSQSGWNIIDWSYIFMLPFPFFLISRLWGKIQGEHAAENEHHLPVWLNTLLLKLGEIEAQLLKRNRLPIGSSIIVLAQKQ